MRLLPYIIVLLLAGCMSTTVIKNDRGHTWEITSRNDAMVHAKLSNSVEITADNRGAPTIWEKLSQLYMMRWLTEDTKESK